MNIIIPFLLFLPCLSLKKNQMMDEIPKETKSERGGRSGVGVGLEGLGA